MAEPIRPFSNGTEFGAWRARNCHGCTKYNAERFDGACEIDGALGLAYMGDGTVSAEIGRRMGEGQDCPEREPRS